ncbi:hypothetical protein ACUSIJ_20435 [Pseudochelatococcus sp. B33]
MRALLGANRLADQGRFIMTLNDVPEVRRIFGWAAIEPVRLTYTTAGRPTEGREVIISGGGRALDA